MVHKKHTRDGQTRRKTGWPILPFSYSVILLFSLLTACTSGEMAVGGSEEPEQVTLDIPLTRAANDGNVENRVRSARMVAFTAGGKVLVNTLIAGIGDTEGTISFREIVPVGFLDLYLIANEQAGWNLDADFPVGSTRSREDLKKKALAFTAYPVVSATSPIPMFGAYEGIYADTNERVYAPDKVTPVTLGAVSRLYAKVTLNLSCVFADMVPQGDPVELKSVSVVHLPGGSYLSPAAYSGAFFDDGAKTLPSEGVNYDSNAAGFATRDGAFTFYIPEYVAANASNRSYLSVTAGLIGSTSVTKEYKIYIGDGIADGQPGHDDNDYMGGALATAADLTVTRNTHYIFDAKIVGFNQALLLNAKVVTWEDVKIETGYPTYLLTVSRSQIALPSGTQGSAYVSTDHPDGWSATIGAGVAGSPKTEFVGYTAGTAMPTSDYLTFRTTGTITTPDTVKVTAGNVTKKIIVKN